MAGAFIFGSGLAIVPFLYAGCVHELKWLDNRQFLDAVAVAMITPGPVVIITGFIGYLVAASWADGSVIAGLTGAIVAAFATFLPCYFFTIIPAPRFKKWGKAPGVLAFAPAGRLIRPKRKRHRSLRNSSDGVRKDVP